MGRFSPKPQVVGTGASVRQADTLQHPAAVARDMALLDPTARDAYIRGRSVGPWDGKVAATTFQTGRALFVATTRPAWAADAPAVRAALGDLTDAAVAWGKAAPEDDVLATWKLSSPRSIAGILREIRKHAGFEGVPLVPVWEPTEPQVGMVLRLLEARVGHDVILQKLLVGVPPYPPSMTALKAWIVDHDTPRPRGRPRAPNPAILQALANRNGRSLRTLARELGCTSANLCYYVREYRADIDAIARGNT